MVLPRIEKTYFPLKEVEAEWKLSDSDLLYVVENGNLRLSYRATRLRIEFGEYEEVEPGHTVPVYFDDIIYSGLLDLHASDARTILFRGSSKVKSFHIAPPAFQKVCESLDHIEITRDELFLKKEEKRRFEENMGIIQDNKPDSMPKLVHNPTFSDVCIGNLTFRFGILQANVVRILIEARRSGTPWLPGKTVLSRAGSTSFRLADLFKSQPEWRQLIESDGSGLYRIHPHIRID